MSVMIPAPCSWMLQHARWILPFTPVVRKMIRANRKWWKRPKSLATVERICNAHSLFVDTSNWQFWDYLLKRFELRASWICELSLSIPSVLINSETIPSGFFFLFSFFQLVYRDLVNMFSVTRFSIRGWGTCSSRKINMNNGDQGSYYRNFKLWSYNTKTPFLRCLQICTAVAVRLSALSGFEVNWRFLVNF